MKFHFDQWYQGREIRKKNKMVVQSLDYCFYRIMMKISHVSKNENYEYNS